MKGGETWRERKEGTLGFVIMLTDVWDGPGDGSSESVFTVRIPSSSSFFCAIVHQSHFRVLHKETHRMNGRNNFIPCLVPFEYLKRVDTVEDTNYLNDIQHTPWYRISTDRWRHQPLRNWGKRGKFSVFLRE